MNLRLKRGQGGRCASTEISTIAFDSGLGDLSYFHRAFPPPLRFLADGRARGHAG